MLEIHPQIIRRNGRNEFVVLTWDEFEAIQESLADQDDLRFLEQALEEDKDTPTIAHDEVVRRFGNEK